MQIVIDVDGGLYEWVHRQLGADEGWSMIQDAIMSGKVLPKGHGELITKEQMIDLVEFYQMNPQHFDFVNLIDEIRDEKPIIEADRSEE